MKYLCDQMLGTLAKWLRVFGFDTFFTNEKISDDELLSISKKENRVLITRDKVLYQRALKKEMNAFFVDTIDPDKQIRCVLKDEVVDKDKILSRCIVCNSALTYIKREDVLDKVPEKVGKYQDKFWYCSKCDKIFWKGSHYDKMLKKINELIEN